MANLDYLASLVGKRDCCKRGVCIHHQAKAAVKEIKKLKARNKWLVEKHDELLDGFQSINEALTPSAETKRAYFGEFYAYISDTDEDGNEAQRKIIVGWDSIKDIMGAIKNRANV